MERLSVAVITYNEEKNISECLESIKWADEIIVIDSFSTDRTMDICRDYTDKVFQRKWAGFSAQKNHAIDLTTNRWVFVIDADERVSQGLKEEIKGILDEGHSYDGYLVPRKSYFLGRWIKHGGWYPDYSIRFFRKDKGRFEKREVHESIKIDGKTSKIRSPLEHYTYRSLSEYIERMNRYSTLAARELENKGKRPCLFTMLLRPVFTFFKMFILRQGFRDGVYGLFLSVLYSFYTFAKYAKLWEMKNINK